VKVGDMVKHKFGTLFGHGIIVDMNDAIEEAKLLWSCHDSHKIQTVSYCWLRVISESR
jgi:hypothetical protein